MVHLPKHALPIFLHGSWQCRQFCSKKKKDSHYVRSLQFCFYFQTTIFTDSERRAYPYFDTSQAAFCASLESFCCFSLLNSVSEWARWVLTLVYTQTDLMSTVDPEAELSLTHTSPRAIHVVVEWRRQLNYKGWGSDILRVVMIPSTPSATKF